MKIKPILSGVAVIVLAAGVIGTAFTLPARTTAAETSPEYVPMGQTFSLACTGGATRTVESGVNVNHEAESISGQGVVFVDGAQWFDIAQQSSVDATTIVSHAESDLGVTQATGVVYASDHRIKDGHIMGASIVRIGGADMRGLAANPCQWARQSVWLSGSQAKVGTYNSLAILNPGENPITVSVNAYGATGPLELTSNHHIVVPAKSRSQISLDGLIPDTAQLALHLTSDSGVFSASLQTNSLDGLTPQGMSFVSHSDSGKNIVIPGLVIPENRAVEADNAEKHHASVRIVNPQQEEITAHVSLIGEREHALAGAQDVRLPAQSVIDLTLDGTAPGAYAVRIAADQPITGSVNMSIEGTAGKDQAWIGAQPSLRTGGAAVTGTASLVLTTPTNADVTITGYDSHGQISHEEQRHITGTQQIELPDGLDYVWVTASSSITGSIYATQPLNSGTGITAIPLTAQGTDAQGVRVNVHPNADNPRPADPFPSR